VIVYPLTNKPYYPVFGIAYDQLATFLKDIFLLICEIVADELAASHAERCKSVTLFGCTNGQGKHNLRTIYCHTQSLLGYNKLIVDDDSLHYQSKGATYYISTLLRYLHFLSSVVVSWFYEQPATIV